MYRLRRLHTQNFLRDPKLVDELIGKSSLCRNDTVLEIGPGKGIITEKLIERAGKVIAIELDPVFSRLLKNKFNYAKNIQIYEANFLNFKLPGHPYKIFANIPFAITADIIRKITNDNNFQEAYLIVQKEAAKKFIGMPYDNRNQMVSVLLKPWFEITPFYEFVRSDFYPTPGVDCTMIRISRVKDPIIKETERNLYNNYVLYQYNKNRVSGISYGDLLENFKAFVRQRDIKQINKVNNEARKITESQKYISKIHRTRKDENWRKFRR